MAADARCARVQRLCRGASSTARRSPGSTRLVSMPFASPPHSRTGRRARSSSKAQPATCRSLPVDSSCARAGSAIYRDGELVPLNPPPDVHDRRSARGPRCSPPTTSMRQRPRDRRRATSARALARSTSSHATAARWSSSRCACGARALRRRPREHHRGEARADGRGGQRLSRDARPRAALPLRRDPDASLDAAQHRVASRHPRSRCVSAPPAPMPKPCPC